MEARRTLTFFGQRVAQVDVTPEPSELILGHASAIENEVRHRHNVSFKKGRCHVRNRGTAEALAKHRNLAITLEDNDQAQGNAIVRSMKANLREMVPSNRKSAIP